MDIVTAQDDPKQKQKVKLDKGCSECVTVT